MALRSFSSFCILLPALFFAGCSAVLDDAAMDEMVVEEARLTVMTSTQKALLDLPSAAEMITASVYNFEDYTGQNKPAETPQYSKAVTQGGVAILKQALVDAGSHRWFRVLERGGLEHLLQERNIIRSVRESYIDADGAHLPPPSPLLYSGLLLEGGIVGYDSNTLTGGAGARYLGIGGSTEYRRDIVTVYLRAVSVMSGEVMISVSTSKTVVSTKVQGGVYKFVSFDKLLEAETGFSINEPSQLAVRQAVEMAVYAMIMEGAAQDLWNFADNEKARTLYRDYLKANDRVGSDAAFAVPTPQAVNVSASVASEPAQSAGDKEKTDPSVLSRTENNAGITTPAPSSAQIVRKTDEKKATNVVRREIAVKPPLEKKPISNTATKKGAGYLEKFQLASERVPTGFYIQVGVYKPFDAWGQEMLGKVEKAGFAYALQKARIDSVDYVRLLIGPFSDRSECVRALGRVAGQFGSGMFIKYVD